MSWFNINYMSSSGQFEHHYTYVEEYEHAPWMLYEIIEEQIRDELDLVSVPSEQFDITKSSQPSQRIQSFKFWENPAHVKKALQWMKEDSRGPMHCHDWIEVLWNHHATDEDRLDVMQSRLHLHIKEKLWSMLNDSVKHRLIEQPDSLTCLMHDCPYLPEIKTHPRLENVTHQLNTIKTLLNTNELNKDVLALVVHQPQTSNGPSDFDFSMED